MYKLNLEKAEEPEIKLPTSIGSSEKQENSRKTFTFASLTMLKPLIVWITKKKQWKIHEEMEIPDQLPASCKTCMKVKKQQLGLDMEQWTGSKLEEEYVKAVYCHPAYLTFMQSASCEIPGWMKHKL